jgi:DNA-binding Lrp family transcriptional regulator
VVSCHAVTGDADYILRVRTADLTELNDFVLALLAHGKDRLHVRSLVVLETIKDCV